MYHRSILAHFTIDVFYPLWNPPWINLTTYAILPKKAISSPLWFFSLKMAANTPSKYCTAHKLKQIGHIFFFVKTFQSSEWKSLLGIFLRAILKMNCYMYVIASGLEYVMKYSQVLVLKYSIPYLTYLSTYLKRCNEFHAFRIQSRRYSGKM